VSDLLKQDPGEPDQKYSFRQKYTLLTETSLKQLATGKEYSPEEIISIGRSKTNKIFHSVSYPPEIEKVIGLIDGVQSN
jgi:hypothetical protein